MTNGRRRASRPRARQAAAVAAAVLLLGGASVVVVASAAASAAPTTLAAARRADGGLRCSAERVLRPLSTRDVSQMVSALYAEALAANATTGGGGGGGVSVRAARSRFLTPTTLACPGTQQQQQQQQQQGAATAASFSPSAVSRTAMAKGSVALSTLGTGASLSSSSRGQQQQQQPTQPEVPLSPPPPTRVSLLTDGLDAVLEVLPAPKRQMRVQAGMTVGQLLAAASAVGMSAPVGALPSFSGLTLGGALATAAHGSSAGGASTLADMVLEATWVDGTGAVLTASMQDFSADARALAGGLGLTGVVTELLLQLTSPTLTHALAALDAPDDALFEDFNDLLASSPHVTVAWRPDLRRYSAWALYSESEGEAPARRARERRERIAARAAASVQGKEKSLDGSAEPTRAVEAEEEDARAVLGLEAAAATSAAERLRLLAWQRDVGLQGSPREEAAACAVSRAESLGRAPFAYPTAGKKGRGGGSVGGAGERAADRPLLSRLGFGGAARRGRAQERQGAPDYSGGRIAATDRLNVSFVGRTNDMAAAGCADGRGEGAAPLCPWAPLPSAPPSAAAGAPVRSVLGGSGFHFALDMDDLPAWIEDARWAVEAELQDDAAIPQGGSRCLPPGAIILRFGGGLADEERGKEEEEEAAQGSDDADVRMDLAAPPDPAQQPQVQEQEERQAQEPPRQGDGAAGAAAATTAVLSIDESGAAGLLSPVSALRRPVYIQAITSTLTDDAASSQAVAKYGWVLDALEKFTYCAYPSAAPFFGDSSERALLAAAGSGCPPGLGARLPGYGAMLAAQRARDPLGMFEPELFARVRRAAAAAEAEGKATAAAAAGEESGEEQQGAEPRRSEEADDDGCAAVGRCYCREDRHCATGFGCVESNAFAGINVCKPWAVILAAETAVAEEEEEGGEASASLASVAPTVLAATAAAQATPAPAADASASAPPSSSVATRLFGMAARAAVAGARQRGGGV